MTTGDESPAEYSVDLDSLEFYAKKVEQAVNNYKLITAQLTNGDVTRADAPFGALLCDPEPEHGGGPGAFSAACQSTIKNYTDLYSKILQTHNAILARLEHMQVALTQTRLVYSELETTSTKRFRRIFEGLPGKEEDLGASRPS